MTALSYRVLGPVDVLSEDGQPINLGRRKQRILLAILLVEANRVVSLDRLVDLLWPEEPPAQAISSVHGYISNLRRLLEPGRVARATPGVIVTHAPGYMLRVASEALDADRFERLLGDGHRLASGDRMEAAAQALESALDLWRGPAFGDFDDQPFARAEVARLEELRLVTLEARMEVELALGRGGQAVAQLEQLVVLHPLRERLRGLLVLALYQSGRQAEALRALHSARTFLKEELGIDPGPALRGIEADVLSQSPSLHAARPFTNLPNGAPPGKSSRPRPPLPVDRAPIIGRRVELEALDAALSAAIGGHGMFALVSGEPGMGKTRLVEELAVLAADRDVQAVWGPCYEGLGAPAFWPWTQVVKALVAAFDESDVRLAVGADSAQLVQIFPDLRPFRTELVEPDIVDPATVRFRAYQALASFIGWLSRRRPLVVILDDLQSADVASLDLTEFLLGAVEDMPLLMVGTYRRSEVTNAGGHPLSTTLAALARRPVLELGPLPGLSSEEVAELMESHLGAAPASGQAALVRARSDGNPFFVVELIRLMGTRRAASPGGEGEPGQEVPMRVRDVVRARLARLPEATNAVLELAAVIGREFDLDVLEGASGLGPDDTLRLLELALVTGVVVDSPDAVARYRFSHALVQETLYGELHAVRRARLHLRVADAMETLHQADDDRVGEMAHHFALAASADGRAKAFAYTVRLADVANARFAFEQARDQLHRGLELLETLPPGPDRDRDELGVQLRLAGWIATTDGWTAADAATAWTRARELAHRVGGVSQLLGALWGQWVLALMAGGTVDADAVARELVELGETTLDQGFRLAGACTTGYGCIHRGDFRTGLALADLTEDLARSMDPEWMITTFHVHLGVLAQSTSSWAAYLLGDEDDACRRATDALAVAARAGHPFSLVSALLPAAVLHVMRGDIEMARMQSEELIEVSSQHGIRPYLAFGGIIRGWAAVHHGDVEEGGAQVEETMLAIEHAGWALLRPVCLALLADVRARAGRFDEALAAVERGVESANAFEDRYWEPELWRVRGELLAAHWPERRADAYASLLRAANQAEQQGAKPVQQRVAESLADFGAPTGRAPATAGQEG
jgi:DNA-binding SARP family transcriptional activator/predicted ATPase